MQKSKLKAVILAGGEGTRLLPLTLKVPKPMLPVVNRPFLEHTVAQLKASGVRDIVLAISYLPEVIRGHFADGRAAGISLRYSVEKAPLGTAGAVKNAGSLLDDTFAVLNGDIFAEVDFEAMLRFHRERGARVTIALTRVENPSAFGVVEIGGEGRVGRFIEKPPPGRVTSRWINAGVYIMEPEVLKYIPGDTFYMFERGLFPHLLELGQPVFGYPLEGYWLDMGTPEKYLELNCDLLRLKARSALVGECVGLVCGEETKPHPSARITGPVVVGHACSIGRDVRITGPVVIGDGCSIGEGAVIETAVLWPGTSIEAGAQIRGCVRSA